MANGKFKGSLFGGFRRSDVVDYIAQSSLEHQSALAALEKEREALAGENASLKAASDEMHAELAALRGECEQLRSQLAESEKKLEELYALRAENDALRNDCNALKAESEALRLQADAYAAAKDHIAELELSARREADEIRARAKAEVETTLQDCRAKCSEILPSVNEVCNGVSGEFRKAMDLLSHLPDAFHSLRKQLDNFGKK